MDSFQTQVEISSLKYTTRESYTKHTIEYALYILSIRTKLYSSSRKPITRNFLNNLMVRIKFTSFNNDLSIHFCPIILLLLSFYGVDETKLKQFICSIILQNEFHILIIKYSHDKYYTYLIKI